MGMPVIVPDYLNTARCDAPHKVVAHLLSIPLDPDHAAVAANGETMLRYTSGYKKEKHDE